MFGSPVEMAHRRMALFVVVALVAWLFGSLNVHASAGDHKYAKGDFVPLYANKVGPFHNPRLDLTKPLTFFTFSSMWELLRGCRWVVWGVCERIVCEERGALNEELVIF